MVHEVIQIMELTGISLLITVITLLFIALVSIGLTDVYQKLNTSRLERRARFMERQRVAREAARHHELAGVSRS